MCYLRSWGGYEVSLNPWKRWSEREDLNLRPPVPQTGALTRLRYAPILSTRRFKGRAPFTERTKLPVALGTGAGEPRQAA